MPAIYGKKLRVLFLALFTLMLFSCTLLQEERPPATKAVVYVDLKYIYEYVRQHDPDYQIYKESRSLGYEFNSKLTEEEREIKRSILLKIDSAVRYVARENGADLVFQKDKGLVYGDSALDITQLVINELKERAYRESPSSK